MNKKISRTIIILFCMLAFIQTCFGSTCDVDSDTTKCQKIHSIADRGSTRYWLAESVEHDFSIHKLDQNKFEVIHLPSNLGIPEEIISYKDVIYLGTTTGIYRTTDAKMGGGERL